CKGQDRGRNCSPTELNSRDFRNFGCCGPRLEMYNVIQHMRTVIDIFAQIFRNRWTHKLRSFLTMFGIAWGVGSLLLLVGVGEGFRSGQRKNMANIGEDIIFVWSGRIPAVAGQHQGMRPYFLTYKDYLDIRNEARLVRYVVPIINRGDLRAQSEFANTSGQ